MKTVWARQGGSRLLVWHRTTRRLWRRNIWDPQSNEVSWNPSKRWNSQPAHQIMVSNHKMSDLSLSSNTKCGSTRIYMHSGAKCVAVIASPKRSIAPSPTYLENLWSLRPEDSRSVWALVVSMTGGTGLDGSLVYQRGVLRSFVGAWCIKDGWYTYYCHLSKQWTSK